MEGGEEWSKKKKLRKEGMEEKVCIIEDRKWKSLWCGLLEREIERKRGERGLTFSPVCSSPHLQYLKYKKGASTEPFKRSISRLTLPPIN